MSLHLLMSRPNLLTSELDVEVFKPIKLPRFIPTTPRNSIQHKEAEHFWANADIGDAIENEAAFNIRKKFVL